MADTVKNAENAVKAVNNSNIPRMSNEYIEMMRNTAQALSANQQEATKIANDAFNASMGALKQSVASANQQNDTLYNQARTSLSETFTDPNVSNTTINKLNTARTAAMGNVNAAGDSARISAQRARNQAIGNARDAYYSQMNKYRTNLGTAGIEAAETQRQDERAFNYNKAKNIRDYNYEKYTDARDFNYSKAKDTRDFNYTKANNAADRRLSLEKQAYERAEDQRKQRMDTYVDTISRFDTSGKIDSEISRLQKSSDPDRGSKIMYLQAYKAQLAAAAAGGYSSSGGRSYGSRSYSSRSRSSGGSSKSSSGSSSAVPKISMAGIAGAGDSAMSPYLEYGTQRGIRTMGDAAMSPYLTNSRQAQGQAFVNVAASSNSKVDTGKVATYVMTHPTATAEDIMNSNLNDREALMAIAALGIDGTEPKLDTTRAKEAAKASESKKTKKTKSKKTNSYEATSAYKYAAQAARNIVNNLSGKR